MSHRVHLRTGQRRRGPPTASPLTDLELAQEDQRSTPILLLLLLPQTTCTRKHMHAHMHICTDVEPPSAPAAPCLAPPCLPPSPPPLTYYSVYAVTLTPNYNLNLPPYFPGLLFLVSPWVFRGLPCAVSLASTPLSAVLSAWSLTGRVRLGPELSVDSPSAPRDPQLRGRLLPSSHASSSFFTGISCWTHT